MSRYYVELKRNLKQKRSISFYMMAYNRTQVIDMFGDEYYVVAVDPTEQDCNSYMTKTKQQQKEDDMILLSWEDYSKKYNTYSILAWIVYIILFIPMLITWIIVEFRKD